MDKPLKIKIPIYTSKFYNKENRNMLIPGIDYHSLIRSLSDKLDHYNKIPDKQVYLIPNTTKKRVIENVKYYNKLLGEIPLLVVSISAYETNLSDVYVEVDERIHLSNGNKVGSEHYMIVLYPEISGITPNNFEYRWIAFIYEEPTKDKGEILSICKLFLHKIACIKTKNVKLPNIMNEIRQMGTIDQLAIRFFTVEKQLNDVSIRYKEYLSDCRFKKEKNTVWDNIPAQNVEDIIANDIDSSFSGRDIKLKKGSKEYRYSESLDDAAKQIENLAEEIFNEEIEISASDLDPDKLYNPDIILGKITPVIQNYVSTYAR